MRDARRPRPALCAIFVSGALAWTWASAQAQDETSRSEAPDDAQPTRDEARAPADRELEARFQKALTDVTFEGTWQMTGSGGLSGNGPLTDPRPESYAIRSAVKLAGDRWIITARIRFADTDVSVPVPVRVVWAEDTPIITVNEFTLPGVGTYSARVMIYEGFYCGTWLSKKANYGGVMSGRIVPTPDEEESEEPPAEPQ